MQQGKEEEVMLVKHRMGNDPMCYECRFYTEEEAPRTKQIIGYCSCKEHLRLGINGKIRNKIPERERVERNDCCRFWVDAESGHTRFEILTGYKEPYDGTEADFNENKKDGDIVEIVHGGNAG